MVLGAVLALEDKASATTSTKTDHYLGTAPGRLFAEGGRQVRVADASNRHAGRISGFASIDLWPRCADSMETAGQLPPAQHWDEIPAR